MDKWTYEKEDFFTIVPYEELYKLNKESFTHAARLAETAVYASGKGFKGFKDMYKKYIQSLRVQNDMIYVDDTTTFTGQPIELNAGDWDAGDDGIYKKHGFESEIACPIRSYPLSAW